MKNLKDFESEINKCSKCGLCQSVCPVYKITGNDCAVSKGKFIMLKGVLKNDLKLNKTINKYLDMCLKCGKCKDFCPSDIDVCKIFETAKYEYAKNTFLGKIVFFLQSKFVFGNLLKIIKKNFCHAELVSASQAAKFLYFRGCAGKFSDNTVEILKKFNIEVIEQDFDCCGIPFLSSGNLERFEEVKNFNKSLIEKSEFDYILTDCASCESTLRSYFEDDRYKFISLGEVLQKSNLKSEKPLKITFHKPCHLKNADFIEPLFQNIENIEYIESEGFDDCCGFAGEFALKNRTISRSISKKKAQNIINTGADYVVTTCPSCILGLKQGLRDCKSKIKVIDLSEFIRLFI